MSKLTTSQHNLLYALAIGHSLQRVAHSNGQTSFRIASLKYCMSTVDALLNRRYIRLTNKGVYKLTDKGKSVVVV